MFNANGGKFNIQVFNRDDKGAAAAPDTANTSATGSVCRTVYQIDVLSPSRLFGYMAKNWISAPSQKAQYTFNSVFDSNRLHEQRMDILNEKGLKGLYEAIIETSGVELVTGLKSIVKYFESLNEAKRNSNSVRKGGVVIHCVQGKDRYVSELFFLF